MTDPKLVYVVVEVNYRWRGGIPECAFCTLIEQRNETHRRIVDTRHLTGSPERLIDQVQELTRRWTLEHVLANVEPF